jgi:hypothetical protein
LGVAVGTDWSQTLEPYKTDIAKIVTMNSIKSIQEVEDEYFFQEVKKMQEVQQAALLKAKKRGGSPLPTRWYK